jgi:hypothetical protein
MSNLLEKFTAELSRNFFLAEYSFSKNQFLASCGHQCELADHVVALPDALFIFQLKERATNAATDQESIEAWFQHKVIKGVWADRRFTEILPRAKGPSPAKPAWAHA